MNLISVLYLVSSIAVLLTCLFKEVNWWWSILPTVYLLTNIIFPKSLYLSNKRLIYFVFNIICYIRYTIIPLLFILAGNEYQNYLIKEPSRNALSLAAIIMAIEIILSLFMIQVLSKKNIKQNMIIRNSKNKNFFLWSVVLMSVMFLLFFPELRLKFNFISVPEVLEKPEIKSSLIALFGIVADYILVIPPIIIIAIYVRKRESNIYSVFTLLLLLTPFLLFFKGVSRFSALLPALAWILTLNRVFPQYRKIITNVILLLASIVFISVSLYKQFASQSLSEISSSSFNYSATLANFNAYFSGLFNVAYGVDISVVYSNINGLSLFINDFFRNIAFFSYISDSENTTVIIYNNYLYNNIGSIDQIIPLISQGYLYLGYAGSILITIVIMYFMIRLEYVLHQIKNINYLFPIAMISIYLSIHMMVSINSIYAPLFNFLLPLLLILKINDKFGKVRIVL